MNVDPNLIAALMTEDPDKFNILNEDAQPGDFSKRQAFMVRMVLIANPNARIPETAEGYDRMGRTEGFLKYTTQDSSWPNLIVNKQFQMMLANLSPELRKQIVTEIARTVSRS